MQDNAQLVDAVPGSEAALKRPRPPTVFTMEALFGGCEPDHQAGAPPRPVQAMPAGEAVLVAPGCLRVGRTGERLAAHLEGPALAILIWDPVSQVGGCGHFLLPSSRTAVTKTAASDEPARYVDAGLPQLIQAVLAAGGELGRLQVTLAGGAVASGKDLFQVGQRNLTAARKALWQLKLLVQREEIGGSQSRDLSLECTQGTVRVQTLVGICAA